MSADEAKKLITEGLAKLQEGFVKLCESVDGLADPDRPAPGSLMDELQKSQQKTNTP